HPQRPSEFDVSESHRPGAGNGEQPEPTGGEEPGDHGPHQRGQVRLAGEVQQYVPEGEDACEGADEGVGKAVDGEIDAGEPPPEQARAHAHGQEQRGPRGEARGAGDRAPRRYHRARRPPGDPARRRRRDIRPGAGADQPGEPWLRDPPRGGGGERDDRAEHHGSYTSFKAESSAVRIASTGACSPVISRTCSAAWYSSMS